MFRVSEVYEKQIRTTTERPDGSEYVTFEKVYDTRESLINLDYVVSVQPFEFSSSLEQSKTRGRFPDDAEFCLFVLDGNSFRTSEIIVVGSFARFAKELHRGPS